MSQRQCLPIDNEESSKDSEFNFDLGQLSALEYLKKVRSGRKKLPQIVTKEIPPEYRNFNVSCSSFFTNLNGYNNFIYYRLVIVNLK